MSTPSPFLTRHEVLISTLSPVHIGCGEDYEPTHYFKDGDKYLIFNDQDLLAVLDEQTRGQLLRAANGSNPLDDVRAIIHQLKPRLKNQPGVRTIPDLSAKRPRPDIKIKWIERTMFNPQDQQPVLPGSSLKGAIRTAWANQYPDLLRVPIPADPFRLLAVTDAHVTTTKLGISYLRRVHKFPHPKPGSPSSVRYDYLLEILERGCKFEGSLRFQENRNPEIRHGQTPDLSRLVKACNDYYLPKLDQTRKYLRAMNDGYGKDWEEFIAANFDSPAMMKHPKDPSKTVYTNTFPGLIARKKGFLLRVGKHGGAESLTLDGMRKINTKYGKDKEETLTMTLTANNEEKPVDASPFGWVFVQLR